MHKKIILLYPYYKGISGAYNRYLLLEKIIKKAGFSVKLILLYDKKSNSYINKIISRLIKFLKVECLIFFYSVFKNYYFITDFNPSIIALFSRNVLIQIHDVSWDSNKFLRHNLFSYIIFKFFIKYYSKIITVSKSSMKAIKNVSGRKKEVYFLYNSVSENFIKVSNQISHKRFLINTNTSKMINKDLPNIIYIATLIPRKCHLDLLQALSKTEVLLNVNLVGLPNDKKILELIKNKKTLTGDKIKSNINYFPKLSQKELCNLLIYSSAYISPSLNEGFGIPVLEAEIYKLPLIIRDIDINRELFPKASFFESHFQLANLLGDLKPLSKIQIEERKIIASQISEDNIIDLFNYSKLSDELKNIILN